MGIHRSYHVVPELDESLLHPPPPPCPQCNFLGHSTGHTAYAATLSPSSRHGEMFSDDKPEYMAQVRAQAVQLSPIQSEDPAWMKLLSRENAQERRSRDRPGSHSCTGRP